MDNLPELKDIHLPTDGVDFFPLAKGWWIVLIAVLLMFLLLRLLLWVKKTSKKLYARYLLKKYATEDSIQSAIKMSEILRRICISRYPEAVALAGDKWVDFLNSKAKQKLNDKTASLLVNAPYVPEESTNFLPADVADLRKFCFEWVGANL